MSSISYNVSAKAGDLEDDVIGPSEARASKKTMKVWSMGLLAWGLKAWCSCLVNSKNEKVTMGGFRGEESKEKSQS